MPNDVKLQSPEGKHPVDENLRPILVGNKLTALEVAQHGDGCRINGDLEVTGNVPPDPTRLPLAGGTMTGNLDFEGEDLKIQTSDDFKLDIGGDLEIDIAGNDLNFTVGGSKFAEIGAAGTRHLTLYEASGATDSYCNIGTTSSGATVITTVDDAGEDGLLWLDIDGDIILDSATGKFPMKNNGTEFIPDMYAGMILGYTALGIDSATATYTTTTSWAVIDSTAKITFVAPPSGNVEIFVSVYVDTDIGRFLEFGLSDNASYSPINFPNTDDVTNEHTVYKGDETDEEMVSHHWVVTGLTSGTSYEWWFAATSTPSAGAYVLKWGGDATDLKQPFIMKATALPATIYTG